MFFMRDSYKVFRRANQMQGRTIENFQYQPLSNEYFLSLSFDRNALK